MGEESENQAANMATKERKDSPATADPVLTQAIQNKMQIEGNFKSGANWFFWIAGMSLINSIVCLVGSNWNFVIGLGITQIFDGIGISLAEKVGSVAKIAAFGLDVGAAGVFVIFGLLARKKFTWAFILGMIVYAFDGLIFLMVQDFLSIAFHGLALWFIFSGYKSCRKLIANSQ